MNSVRINLMGSSHGLPSKLTACRIAVDFSSTAATYTPLPVAWHLEASAEPGTNTCPYFSQTAVMSAEAEKT